MFKSFDFCLATKSTTVPDTDEWLHKIKYDGYRLRLERDGDRVRLTAGTPAGKHLRQSVRAG
jgi:ATP-dependent DNA ligase